MNRVAGLETEYGCLISEDQAQSQADAWPVKIKNHLFRKCRVGAIDLHYRDYEEPPGNGGFLLNGGRFVPGYGASGIFFSGMPLPKGPGRVRYRGRYALISSNP